jgi:hypothetical protein
MRTVGRYTWGKTEKGYGWNLWKNPEFAVERDGPTGHYGVYEADGTLVCRCVSYQDAQKVVAMLRRLLRALVTPRAIPTFARLIEREHGYIVRECHTLEDFGATFATREEAEAYLRGNEHIHQA